MTGSTDAASPWRLARISQYLDDHGHRFHQLCPGSEARYVLDTWFRDATPAERDFAYGYVRSRPELFTTMPQPTEQEVTDRDRASARYHDDAAGEAAAAGDYELALYLLDAADWWMPGSVDQRKRDYCAQRAGWVS